MMKLLEKLKNRKSNNKGFSLVELIIVIAIMAILIGIVGTQVVPYLNKSKVSKDRELMNSFSTAAMTAYSSNADKVSASGTLTVLVYGTNSDATAATLATEIQKLTYDNKTTIAGKFTSNQCKEKVNDIKVTYNFTSKTITVEVLDSAGATIDIEAVTSDM
ncbi:MAG: type II secretion system protein [Agathobacter sp.]|nr:type II secretion system protein [Agathobacter sp.]